jgi:hypothetical protein
VLKQPRGIIIICAQYFVNNFFKKIAKNLRITFRLFATFQPAYKAMRSIAAGWNVGEGGVGMERSGMT